MISQTEHCLLLGVVHHDEARLRLEGQLTNIVVIHDDGGRLAVVADGPQMVVDVEVARRLLTDLLQQRRVGQRHVVLVHAHLGRWIDTAAFVSGGPLLPLTWEEPPPPRQLNYFSLFS